MNAPLYTPRPILVETGPGGRPLAVAGVAVEAVREEWLVEDRWWAERPIARHYFELALADGRCEVVFLERRRSRFVPYEDVSRPSAESGRWFRQRA